MTNGPVKNRSRPIYTNFVGTESLMKMKIIKVQKHQGFHGLGHTQHLMYQILWTKCHTEVYWEGFISCWNLQGEIKYGDQEN